MTVRAMALVPLVALAPALLGAQIPTLEVGTPVRIRTTTSRGIIDGRVHAQRPDTLEIARSAYSGVRNVPSATISRIEIGEDYSHWRGVRKGARRGAIAGAWAGGLFGVWFSPVLYAESDPPGWRSAAQGVVVLSAFGALAGAVVGSPLGGLIGAHRWRTVYEAPLVRR